MSLTFRQACEVRWALMCALEDGPRDLASLVEAARPKAGRHTEDLEATVMGFLKDLAWVGYLVQQGDAKGWSWAITEAGRGVMADSRATPRVEEVAHA